MISGYYLVRKRPNSRVRCSRIDILLRKLRWIKKSIVVLLFKFERLVARKREQDTYRESAIHNFDYIKVNFGFHDENTISPYTRKQLLSFSNLMYSARFPFCSKSSKITRWVSWAQRAPTDKSTHASIGSATGWNTSYNVRSV